MIPSLSRFAIAAIAAFALVPLCSAQSQLAGDWQGTLEADGQAMQVAWHVVAAKDGTITSTLDNIDESIYGIKVKTMSLKGSEITMSVDDTMSINGQDVPVRGNFAGTLSADGNEVDGTWTQTEPEQPPMKVHFKRAAAPPAPAPTSSNSLSIAGDWTGVLNVRGTDLHITLRITQTGRDLAGTLDVAEKNTHNLPVNTISFSPPKLTFTAFSGQGSYEGTLNASADEIDGLWTESDSIALNFRRSSPPASAK